ncbi:SDR family NAD(P)-dependent oxidoreductase [Bacillus sp. 2205SS5-2]|uniref:SDR family NAD(P)-dependent oxidoreductase n=1 Tax=Bacillus sp. 2205SS5-2 TaxID=3109031 RepID=UPI003FA611FE
MKSTVLITGASGGIGLALAKLFAQDQHNLVLVARSEDKLNEIAQDLSKKHSIKVNVIVSDLSKPQAAKQLFEETKRRGLVIDSLINNAGFGLFGEFEKTDMQRELEMIQVNITAVTELSKYFGQEMVERKQGQVLNVASTAAFQPGPLMAVYYATKAYVLSFSEALSNEWKDSGITVSALCPGPTSTGFGDQAELGQSKLFKSGVMDAESVARKAYEGLKQEKTVVIPGMKNKILAKAVRLMPRSIVPSIVRKAQDRV